MVKTEISEIGWSAEMAIPFRTLRFPPGRSQTWGVNFQRNIRRRSEVTYWARLPMQFDLFRLSFAGELTNLEIPRQLSLKLIPYVLDSGQKEGVEDSEVEGDSNIGLDVKNSISPSLTLDGTLNTDFAEVEADFVQVNLDRFNLFFPEKRPFFLENAGYFSVGVPAELQLFYSRRIGLGPDGDVVPIDGGVRLSGKAGHYNLRLLYMGPEEVEGVAPTNRFSVARVGRDLPNRSSIGGILVNRSGSGQFALEDDYNWTYGLDGRCRPAMRKWQTGSTQRSAFSPVTGIASPVVFCYAGFLHIDNHWEFRQGAEVHTGINFTLEGVKEPFEISDGIFVPMGTYENSEVQLIAFTNQSNPLSLEARLVAGGFFGGDRVSFSPGLNFRVGDRFQSSLGLELQRHQSPRG